MSADEDRSELRVLSAGSTVANARVSDVVCIFHMVQPDVNSMDSVYRRG